MTELSGSAPARATVQAPDAGWIPWQTDDYPGAVPWLHVEAGSLGLLVIDVQYSCADPDLFAARTPQRASGPLFEDWSVRMRDLVVPNTRRLIDWFREHGRPVIFTRVGSLLPDAEDQHPWRRLAWLRTDAASPPYRSPVGARDHGIVPEVAPTPDELVLDKNASGAFPSSGLEFYLHQLGLRTLVIAGVATYACVDNTARAAADRGYNVIVVEDACAGTPGGEEAHDATLRTFAHHFGAVKTTRELEAQLADIVEAPATVGAGRG